MADQYMNELAEFPDGGIQAEDIIWLSRDNGDDTHTSYKIKASQLLAFVSNMFNNNGTINNSGVTTGVARSITIGENSVLNFNWANINSLTMSPTGLTFSQENFVNKSLFIESGENQEYTYLMGSISQPMQADISITANGDSETLISTRLINTYKFDLTNTSEVDTTTLFSVGDTDKFGITITPLTGGAGFKVRLENLDLTQQRWSIRVKYNIG